MCLGHLDHTACLHVDVILSTLFMEYLISVLSNVGFQGLIEWVLDTILSIQIVHKRIIF